MTNNIEVSAFTPATCLSWCMLQLSSEESSLLHPFASAAETVRDIVNPPELDRAVVGDFKLMLTERLEPEGSPKVLDNLSCCQFNGSSRSSSTTSSFASGIFPTKEIVPQWPAEAAGLRIFRNRVSTNTNVHQQIAKFDNPVSQNTCGDAKAAQIWTPFCTSGPPDAVPSTPPPDRKSPQGVDGNAQLPKITLRPDENANSATCSPSSPPELEGLLPLLTLHPPSFRQDTDIVRRSPEASQSSLPAPSHQPVEFGTAMCSFMDGSCQSSVDGEEERHADAELIQEEDQIIALGPNPSITPFQAMLAREPNRLGRNTYIRKRRKERHWMMDLFISSTLGRAARADAAFSFTIAALPATTRFYNYLHQQKKGFQSLKPMSKTDSFASGLFRPLPPEIENRVYTLIAFSTRIRGSNAASAVVAKLQKKFKVRSSHGTPSKRHSSISYSADGSTSSFPMTHFTRRRLSLWSSNVPPKAGKVVKQRQSFMFSISVLPQDSPSSKGITVEPREAVLGSILQSIRSQATWHACTGFPISGLRRGPRRITNRARLQGAIGAGMRIWGSDNSLPCLSHFGSGVQSVGYSDSVRSSVGPEGIDLRGTSRLTPNASFKVGSPLDLSPFEKRQKMLTVTEQLQNFDELVRATKRGKAQTYDHHLPPIIAEGGVTLCIPTPNVDEFPATASPPHRQESDSTSKTSSHVTPSNPPFFSVPVHTSLLTFTNPTPSHLSVHRQSLAASVVSDTSSDDSADGLGLSKLLPQDINLGAWKRRRRSSAKDPLRAAGVDDPVSALYVVACEAQKIGPIRSVIASLRAAALKQIIPKTSVSLQHSMKNSVRSTSENRAVEVTLDLDHTYCGPVGCRPMIYALQRLPNLRKLALSAVGLTDETTEWLCHIAVHKLTFLEQLDVSNNAKIRWRGGNALLSLARSSVRISKLNVNGTKIRGCTRRAIERRILANNSRGLTEVSVVSLTHWIAATDNPEAAAQVDEEAVNAAIANFDDPMTPLLPFQSSDAFEAPPPEKAAGLVEILSFRSFQHC